MFDNRTIELAHNQIIYCERDLNRMLSRGECRDLLQDLFASVKNSAHAEQLLLEIDMFGFDNWVPRK